MNQASNAASSCMTSLDLVRLPLLFCGEIAGVIDAGYPAAAPFAILTRSRAEGPLHVW
jgi:hypothetical protein